MALTITGFAERINKKDQRKFVSLTVESDLALIAKKSGGFRYATLRAHMPIDMSVDAAKALVGKTVPGKIVKVPCTPREWINPRTKEKVMIDFNYEVVPE